MGKGAGIDTRGAEVGTTEEFVPPNSHINCSASFDDIPVKDQRGKAGFKFAHIYLCNFMNSLFDITLATTTKTELGVVDAVSSTA